MRSRARPVVGLDAQVSVRMGGWGGWAVGEGVRVGKVRPGPAKGARPQALEV